jgi:hypothetical protein
MLESATTCYNTPAQALTAPTAPTWSFLNSFPHSQSMGKVTLDCALHFQRDVEREGDSVVKWGFKVAAVAMTVRFK